MHLSTSSSELTAVPVRPAGLRPILVVLAICAAVFLAFEVFARAGVPRLSSFVGRNLQEMSEAEQLRFGKDRLTVLVAGNSVLLDAVDFPKLRNALADRWSSHRLVIEQTSYADWFFGLKRLYSSGARFDTVVMMLSPTNMLQNSVRGDYFARLMMRPQDFWQVGQMLGLHRTDAFNLLVANVSAFYGLKTELRKVLLLRILPDFPKFTSRIVRFERADLREENVRRLGGERLVELRNLVEENGGRFVFAIPPFPGRSNASAVLAQVGAEAGIPVIVSIPAGEFGRELFRDSFHLNQRGSAIYTERFTPDLRRVLGDLDSRRTAPAPAAP